MNLHGIVSGAIGTINPFVSAQIKQSTGWTTSPSGKRVPSYAAPFPASIQMQELSFKDLQHTDGLNLQGVLRSVYLDGSIYGVDRGTAGGGDIFTIGSQTWLVVAVAEQWADWCRVILQLQVAP